MYALNLTGTANIFWYPHRFPSWDPSDRPGDEERWQDLGEALPWRDRGESLTFPYHASCSSACAQPTCGSGMHLIHTGTSMNIHSITLDRFPLPLSHPLLLERVGRPQPNLKCAPPYVTCAYPTPFEAMAPAGSAPHCHG